MTLHQIDILEKDEDIIPANKFSGMLIKGQWYQISKTLNGVLNILFETFLNISVALKKDIFQKDLQVIIDSQLNKKYLEQILEKKIHEQIKIKEQLYFGVYRSADGIKETWRGKMVEQMEDIIGCIKFKIFNGGKIYELSKEKKDSAVVALHKYFLLADELSEIINAVLIDEKIKFLQEKINDLEGLTSQIKLGKKGELQVNQIALIHVYERRQITRLNAKEKALQHGYNAPNSGEGLFQDYTKYSEISNRTGKPTPCTQKRLRNKINLFKSIIKYLSVSAQKRANDEIKILELLYEKEYE